MILSLSPSLLLSVDQGAGLGRKAKARRALEWYCTSALCQRAAALDDRVVPAASPLQDSIVDMCTSARHFKHHLYMFLNKLPTSQSSSHFVRVASKPAKRATAHRVLWMVEWAKTLGKREREKEKGACSSPAHPAVYL